MHELFRATYNGTERMHIVELQFFNKIKIR